MNVKLCYKVKRKHRERFINKIVVCDDDTLFLEKIVQKIESSYKKENIEFKIIKYLSGRADEELTEAIDYLIMENKKINYLPF